MKLYYAPGACSMVVHIVLREAGHPFELDKVDLASKRTQSGADYMQVNPKGYVPALELDDRTVLTEASVCAQYVADLAPQTDLAPLAGTTERYRLMEWMNYVSAELHKTLGALFDPSLPDAARQRQVKLARARFDFVSRHLTGRQHLMGDKFTAADAYLFTILNWSSVLKVDLKQWPVLEDYLKRVADRPAVRETMKAEGLVK